MGLFNTAAVRPIAFLPTTISRIHLQSATHHTDTRDLYQRRRELLPINFASKSVIHQNSLGSFTCHKAGTWDRFFYFPSEGRHTEDFPDARKIQRLRPGLNPRTRVPEASMLTTRPPKPSGSVVAWPAENPLSVTVEFFLHHMKCNWMCHKDQFWDHNFSTFSSRTWVVWSSIQIAFSLR